jgi:hypothetical protein
MTASIPVHQMQNDPISIDGRKQENRDDQVKAPGIRQSGR